MSFYYLNVADRELKITYVANIFIGSDWYRELNKKNYFIIHY